MNGIPIGHRLPLHCLLIIMMALSGCAGQMTVSDISTKPYPPVGSPDPGPPCQRKDRPPWLDFFCKFMTVELWEEAGRPDFTAPDGSRWHPWYYRGMNDLKLDKVANYLVYAGYPDLPMRTGFLEAMLKLDKKSYDAVHFIKSFRYTPWSVYFHSKGTDLFESRIKSGFNFSFSSANPIRGHLQQESQIEETQTQLHSFVFICFPFLEFIRFLSLRENQWGQTRLIWSLALKTSGRITILANIRGNGDVTRFMDEV